MKITLGSTSRHKVTALEIANMYLMLNSKVTAVKAPSGQNEQPVGFKETFAGAKSRAEFAKAHDPESVAIGIESGLFRFEEDQLSFDVSIVVVLTNDNRQIVTSSDGFQLPEEYVKIAKNRGFETTTVGKVIAETLGGDNTDPHAILTKDKCSRVDVLVNAITLALQQL